MMNFMNFQKGSNKTQLIVNGTTKLHDGIGVQHLQIAGDWNVADCDRILE